MNGTPPAGGTGQVQTQQVEYQTSWKFNALIARKFSRLTVKGGVLESTGGLGLDYELVKNRFSGRGGGLGFHPAR